jgi:hypothetical protein
MVDNGYLLYFRWLELLEEPLKDSGQVSLVVLSNHHHHLQTWPRLWLGKLSFLINLCKLKCATFSSNLEAEVNPYRPVTRISSALNRHYSIRPMSLWMQTPGCELLSLSSPYYQPHVQRKTGCFSQPSNSEAMHVFGGISFMQCNPPNTWSFGMSFGLHSEHIIYQQDSLSESSTNF